MRYKDTLTITPAMVNAYDEAIVHAREEIESYGRVVKEEQVKRGNYPRTVFTYEVEADDLWDLYEAVESLHCTAGSYTWDHLYADKTKVRAS